jgi:hypothetical protein
MSDTDSTPRDFYVYLHRKATTGEVFYVGKGRGRRAWKAHNETRSALWLQVVAKHGLIVEIAQDGLQEWYAHELECELISLHGRRDTGHGQLVNFTDGGDGASGCKSSESKKQKLSEHFKGKKRPPDVCAKIKAGLAKPETARNRADAVSRATKGKPMPASRYAALQKYWSDKAKVANRIQSVRAAVCKKVICIETGQSFDAISDAMRWLNESGVSAKSQHKITMACTGRRNTAYGYHWQYADAA